MKKRWIATGMVTVMFGVGIMMGVTEMQADICEVEGCTQIEEHQHNTCGVEGCTQIEKHQHNTCGVENCTQTEKHHHKQSHQFGHRSKGHH